MTVAIADLARSSGPVPVKDRERLLGMLPPVIGAGQAPGTLSAWDAIDLEQSGRRNMARLIGKAFAAAGHPPPVTVAAIVNAWAESRLNPLAWGDRREAVPEGCSGGLFQLNRCGGAGTGMNRADIEDPGLNVRRILEVLSGRQGRPVLEAVARGSRDPLALTAAMTRHILRPSDVHRKAAERAIFALRMFPPEVWARVDWR